MITKNKIRLHFFLIMVAVFAFAVVLGKALPDFGVETYLERTLWVFLLSYGWFFLMIKLWLSYLERSGLLKDVAGFSGKEKSKLEWSDFLGFDVPLGEGFFAGLIAVILVTLFVVLIAYALSVEAPLLLIDAAFEAAIAGGLLRTLRRRDPGSWLKVVFKRTIGLFLIALACGSLLAWSYDQKCKSSSGIVQSGCLDEQALRVEDR